MPPEQSSAGEITWAGILAEVSKRNTTGRSARNVNTNTKTILVLGDEGVGKSTVITNLRGKKQVASEHQGTGMEYAYLEAREEESEALGKTERVGIYTLDGDQDHSVLLQSVLNKETLSDIMVMIVVDLSRPWLVMDSLNKWSRVLADHIETLDADDLLEGLKAEQVKAYRTYTEDQEDTKKDGDGDAETIMLDLDDGVLTSNHGVPIVVVGTKDDYSEQLAQERDFRQEHFDFIQMHIRKFCLSHGAALIYNGKAQKTADALYRYALHLACGLPFPQSACISETEGLFIPRGWDNPTKVSVLGESFSTIKSQDTWGNTICDISVNVENTGAREVIAETEQTFLEKQRTLLSRAEPADSKGGAPQRSGSNAGPGRSSSAVTRQERAPRSPVTSRASPASSRPRGATGAVRDPLARPGATAGSRTARSTAGARTARSATATASPGAAGGDANAKNADVLANFFNSLLSNNPAGGNPGAPRASGSRADAAKELSKMQGRPE